jgi:hypothetical protein
MFDPSAHAIVLSVDEKSQIRRSIARNRAAAGQMTREKQRHDALFAALDVLDGKVIGGCMRVTDIRGSSLPQHHQAGGPGAARSSHKYLKVRACSVAHPRSCSTTRRFSLDELVNLGIASRENRAA